MSKVYTLDAVLELVEDSHDEVIMLTLDGYPAGLPHIDTFWKGCGIGADNTLHDLLSTGARVECELRLIYDVPVEES